MRYVFWGNEDCTAGRMITKNYMGNMGEEPSNTLDKIPVFVHITGLIFIAKRKNDLIL